ncbi:MAG TPA: PQQ-binding-like beta-propeller repeat protein [Dactylosporangium sp.]|jgi:outer membrane protein assembly factor BamB|nr:PQQ-binding-like beta-propeller repeat protein [Dactylosporangium sp.]
MDGAIDLDARAVPAPSARPARHRWPLGLLLVAVLALVAGAAPAAPLSPLLVLPGDGVTDVRVDGRALYLLTRTAVAAYRMPDGARRWTVPAGAGTQIVAVDGDRVVLAVQDAASGTASLAGLDAATGAAVWRRAGYVPSIYGAAGAAGVVVADPDPPPGSPNPDRRLAGLDIRTGDLRWSLGPPAGWRELVFADAGVEIADVDPDGVLRVRSGETGEVVRTARIAGTGSFTGFFVAGDRLLAFRAGQGVFLDSAVFDLRTGRQLWRRTDEPDGIALRWCGRLLCLGTQGDFTVLDPDTGRERWHLTGWARIAQLDEGHMWASDPTRDNPDRSAGIIVLDAATGRVVRRIPAWDVVGAQSGSDVLVATRNTAGGSLVGRLHLPTGAVRILGRAGPWDEPPTCLAAQGLLACRLDRVWIWPAGG